MTWQETLEKASSDLRISAAECEALYTDAPLSELARVANDRRRRRVDPRRVTYLIDRNINYTNVCITDCTFCNFYRRPGDKEAYVLTREVMRKKIQETVDAGGTRILLQGGHHPDLRLSWYTDMLSWIKSEFPALQLDCFSPSEIDQIVTVEKSDTETVLRALKNAGMDGLPGGGAEILDDEIRRRISPKKLSSDGWIDAMRVAQRLGMYTSASMVIGFGETARHRVAHMTRIRDLMDESLAAHGNTFPAFISWTAQLEGNPLGTLFQRKNALPAGPTDYLRNLAISRIYLDGIDHFQASWPTMGPEVAAVALEYGADDFGSTMLEENVVSASGSSHTCMPEDRMQFFIRQAGYIPVQRTSNYTTVKVHEPALQA